MNKNLCLRERNKLTRAEPQQLRLRRV